MSEAERLTPDLHEIRLLEDLHPQLLEIAEAPHVVVALEEIHLHPFPDQSGQAGEDP